MKIVITQLNVPPPIPAAVKNAIAAAPGGQTGATRLAARWNIVTTGGVGTGVVLQLIAGGAQGIANLTGYDLLVFPPPGTTIDGGSANAAIVLPNDATLDCVWNGLSRFVSVGAPPFAAAMAGFFGTGADGNVTITGPVVLTRDMHYRNLTISAAGAISTAGFRVFVAGVLDIATAGAGAISSTAGAGGNASGAVGGGGGVGVTAGANMGSPAASTGGAGGTGAGATGLTGSVIIANEVLMGGDTNPSGAGGAGGSGAGGASFAGRVGSLRVAILFPTPTPAPVISYWRGTITINTFVETLIGGGTSGPSGGGGGGDGTNSGGGGGGGAGDGGVCVVCAATIARGASTAAGAINANGARGGNGAAGVAGNTGGGGGGSGGGGGLLYVLAGTLSGVAATNCLLANGGVGGTGGAGTGTGAAGGGGGAGNGGNIQLTTLSPPSFAASSFNAAPPTAPSGVTGGTPATIGMTL